MKTLNKDYILTMLSKEKLWKVGESNSFIFENWNITLRKEEEIYKPFMYSISGEKITQTNYSVGDILLWKKLFYTFLIILMKM
jgi:hypothetical protein